MPDKLKLVHLSDPHLSSLEGVRWRELLNKRLLGYLSWRLRRRHAHRPEILARLQEELRRLGAEQLIISGDLTHIGTEDECRQALTWLRRLGEPEDTMLVPGNHDRYAPANWQRTLGLWQKYMTGEQDAADSPLFPALRRLGAVALIGLSSAVPTLPFLASGRLGRAQLEALDRLLDGLRKEALFRVLVLHHGPVAGTTSRRRGLDDAKELREILHHRGAELVLHGHGHHFFHGQIEGKIDCQDRTIPVFGVPSASASSDKPERRAGYNVYEIENAADHWHLAACSRVLNKAKDRFEVKKEYAFVLPKM